MARYCCKKKALRALYRAMMGHIILYYSNTVKVFNCKNYLTSHNELLVLFAVTPPNVWEQSNNPSYKTHYLQN